jgi:phospholipid/cholesterol/gamma-HCH transport system substrate-binding protein
MNSTNKKGIIVGIFVFIAIAIVIAGVLTLGGQKKSFVKAVHISAVFPDVNGLAVGNNVWFSGVKIGTIKNISFDNNANVVVQMNIEQKVRKYIKQDSKAKISSDVLIGNKIVVIYGGTPASPVVTDNSRLSVEAALNSEEMLATLQANNKNLLDITNDFKVISKHIASGKGSIGKLLIEESLYKDLQSTMSSLKQTANSAKSISSDLSEYTSRFDQKGTLVNDLVTDTIIFSRLRATVAEINQAANRSNEIINQLTTASAKINDPNTPVGALLNDKTAAGNLKGTLKNLEAASYKLDENMEALQHNFLLRGFFRRKAKAEKQAAGN